MTPHVFPYTPSCADLAGVVVAVHPAPAACCCFEGTAPSSMWALPLIEAYMVANLDVEAPSA